MIEYVPEQRRPENATDVIPGRDKCKHLARFCRWSDRAYEHVARRGNHPGKQTGDGEQYADKHCALYDLNHRNADAKYYRRITQCHDNKNRNKSTADRKSTEQDGTQKRGYKHIQQLVFAEPDDRLSRQTVLR